MDELLKIIELKTYTPVGNVLVVGCGGTGAYVTSYIARLISVLNENKKNKIALFLADGDTVEVKNLARQHFINSDITKNKASTLAERYSSAFGIEIGVFTKDIEKMEDFSFFDGRSDCSNLVIGCVDNNASRKLINEWFCVSHSYGKFWIDSGNEERNGQVICGYTPPLRGSYSSIKIKPGDGKTIGEFSLPSVAECYKEVLNESKFNSELSCAERAISAPQNMQTNVVASTLIMNYAQKLLIGEGLKSYGVEFNIDNSFSTKFNTVENLSVINNDRKRHWEK